MAATVGAAASTLLFNPDVFAAISNRVRLTPEETFVNQSVSFVSTAGRLSSSRPVPTDRFWTLQTMRATNCEAESRAVEFLLLDHDGTTHAVLSEAAVNPVPVPPGGSLSWNGSVKVPAGWRVTARWHGMTGGGRCDWQYTAVERRAGG